MNQSPVERLRQWRRRVVRIIAGIVLLLLTGVGGYMIVEGWSFIDALYMTVITLAGVGYGETHPLHLRGRVFTLVLITMGVVALAFLVNQIVQALGEDYLREGLRITRSQRSVKRMKNHFIVCGFGRMGRRICEEFANDKAPFVVVEADTAACEKARAVGYLVIQGDASADLTLIEAGIAQARCVVCALPSDADNLFIILSARNLNLKVRTIARASSEEAAIKLRRGGADEVVSPYTTGARRMATIALRPGVIDFVETTISGSNRSLYIEEFRLEKTDCPFIGLPILETGVRGSTGALIIAIRRPDGTLIGGPSGDTRLEQGDVLYCLGTSEQLRLLESVLLPLPGLSGGPGRGAG